MSNALSQDERIDILSDIVAIKSVNDNEMEVANYLKDLFEKHGIDAEIDEISDTRANLVATIGEGSPVVGISGHMDVVSEGDVDDWDEDPFELTEKDGYLYGRGTADMKAGLAALAIAMIEIKEQDLLEKGTIKFMATAGEEIEQVGSAQLRDHGYMDDVDALIIGEPSETMLVYAHKGSMDIRVTSTGESSHSSMPLLGQNAIQPLLEFIRNVEADYEDISKSTTFEKLDFSNLVKVGKSMMAKEDVDIDDDGFERIISGLVLSNTIIDGGSQVNSIPDKAVAEFNIRTVPEFNNDKVKELFDKHMDAINEKGGHLEKEVYLDLESVLTTGENDLMKVGYDVATDIFGDDIIVSPTVGVTDASNLLLDKDDDFPFLMLGPGATPHQVDENVKKDTYFNFIDFYTQLLTNYLNK